MRTHIHNLKIYLDTCCLSRLDDIATDARIQREASAVGTILNYCSTGQWLWIGSEVLAFEVNNTPNRNKRIQIQSRLNYVHQNVFLNPREISRAARLESLGFKRLDAMHLACAESGNVDAFFTTDDRLIRLARRLSSQLRIRVENPYEWIQEINRNEHPENDRQ